MPGIPFIAGRNDYPDKDGKKYAIAIHNTSNNATARAEANYARTRSDGVSAHFYVDKTEIIQSIDTKYRTGHAGSTQGNENAISVEITGVNGWSRAQWLNGVSWAKLGNVLAVLCKTYGIPLTRLSYQTMREHPTAKGFYSHDDMRRAWGGTTHNDPGPNFPWDTLLDSVARSLYPPKVEVIAAMNGLMLAREDKTPEVYIGNGITRRHIKDDKELEGVQYWVKRQGGDPTVHVFLPGTIGVLGVLIKPTE